ncbi:MAG: DUF4913 domain-containing protein [Actinobacteria bacterium]|nr:DUF4913 domain-containing protein [Actinomycetota bacterium]
MSDPGAWADLDDQDSVDTTAEEPKTYYTNVDDFVRNSLRPIYRRPINARTTFWAADWWRHPEAVLRLAAMWRSWEQARHDPATGMATWLRDTVDYHMNILMSAQGPFGTSQDTCDPGEPLPYTQPPSALFSLSSRTNSHVTPMPRDDVSKRPSYNPNHSETSDSLTP